MFRIRTYNHGSKDYDYLSRDSSTAQFCNLGWQLQSDDPDLFLWHWCNSTTPAGKEQVSIRNHKTGTWITAQPDHYVWCDRTKQDTWETFDVHYVAANQVELKAQSSGEWLGTNCRAGSKGCERYPDLYPLCRASSPQSWEKWILEDAISVPTGQWVATSSAQAPGDGYTAHVEYSAELSTSLTTSFSASFTRSVEAGFDFKRGSAKTSYSGTVAYSVGLTVSLALSVKSGFSYTHVCPQEVCDGKHTARMYQWKMQADVSGYSLPFYVETGSFAIFAWDVPKCPPTLCEDVQCQKCKTTSANLRR